MAQPSFVNTFFDPGSDYGAAGNPKAMRYKPGEFIATPLGQTQGRDQQNFDALFQRKLAEHGVDSLSNQGRSLWSMLPRLGSGYEAALLTNPLLQPDQYLEQQFPSLLNSFATAGPQGQGRNQGLFAPPAREQSRGF